MPSGRTLRVFDSTIVAKFRIEAAKHTKRFSQNRRFTSFIANVLDGEAKSGRYITVQSIGIILEPGTERYWPLIEEICKGVPELRTAGIEFTSLGIRRSLASR
jgi:hypothetical protein